MTILQQRQLQSRALEAISKDAQRCSPPTAPSCSWNSVALGIAAETLAPCPLLLLLPHMLSPKGILRPKDEPKTWGRLLIIPSMEGLMWHSQFLQ